MINNLTVSSPHLTTSAYNTAYVNNTGQSAGQLRFNTGTQQVEAYDGVAWITISQNISIGLGITAEESFIWIQKKMAEERELKAKMEKYPALKHAHEQFKIIEALVYEEEEAAAAS